MTDLIDLYGETMVLPTGVGGILVSDVFAPHENANGLYVAGADINGFPAYYWDTYVIANLSGHVYALYDKDWLYPDADNEIWNFGPEGTGPVTAGLLGEPFPSLELIPSNVEPVPEAMLQPTSNVNNLEMYSLYTTAEVEAASGVRLPLAASFAPSIPNLLNDFPDAFAPRSFTSQHLGNWQRFPLLFWVCPHSDVTAIILRITGTDGTLINSLDGTATAFGNDDQITLPVVPQKWQAFFIEVSSPSAISRFRFQATGSKIGALVPVLDGLNTNEFYIVGNYDILDFKVTEPLRYKRLDIPFRNVDGSSIDKLLVALAQGAIQNGNFVYNNTPEAADSFRSQEALAAMQSLFNRGWTITR